MTLFNYLVERSLGQTHGIQILQIQIQMGRLKNHLKVNHLLEEMWHQKLDQRLKQRSHLVGNTVNHLMKIRVLLVMMKMKVVGKKLNCFKCSGIIILLSSNRPDCWLLGLQSHSISIL